ncbi:hypothetical protein GCM10010448_47100 [Streptomyces glomeratus]|uniref:Uncharacterized protein n=1 Tax=Streptomyces glomeratus TaxID=284452 RepID=A0ABP6LS73_9ACTN
MDALVGVEGAARGDSAGGTAVVTAMALRDTPAPLPVPVRRGSAVRPAPVPVTVAPRASAVPALVGPYPDGRP